MKNADTLKVTTPSDQEIQITRLFDAPRQLVFDAYTKPELLKRWLFGPDGSDLFGQHHRQEPLLWPVRRLVRRPDPVGELDPGRRLLVDELRVGHLGEVDQARRCPAAAGLGELGARRVTLARPVLQPVVVVPVDDRANGRLRARHRGGRPREKGERERCSGELHVADSLSEGEL